MRVHPHRAHLSSTGRGVVAPLGGVPRARAPASVMPVLVRVSGWMDAGTGARTEGKGDTLSRTHGGVALSNSRRDLVICRERCLENIKRDMKTHTHTERERERERGRGREDGVEAHRGFFFSARVARGAVTIHQSLLSRLNECAEENSLSAIPRLV
jgi:hypothetical protein